VFTSDNGPSKESYLAENYDPDFFNGFGPFDGIKRDLLEGGIRVSAIAHWPGHFPAGTLIKTPSSSYDWLPTFAQLAGVPAPAVADGVSLVPSLTGKGKQDESFVYVEYFEGGKTPAYNEFLPEHQSKKRNQMQMIFQDNFVGLRYDIKSQGDDFEIFDVKNDPQQAHNLAANPGMGKVQQLMKDKVLQSRRPNDSAKRPYDNDLVSSVSGIKTKAGIKWTSYSGDFNWVPNLSTLTPSATGTCNSPATNLLSKSGKKAISFNGYLQIPADGEYTFYLTAVGKAFLRIHQAALIDADFDYQSGTEQKATINLKSGLHPFNMYYIATSGEKPLLSFDWSVAGNEKQAIPESVFRMNTQN
jgi:hypothetical protein